MVTALPSPNPTHRANALCRALFPLYLGFVVCLGPSVAAASCPDTDPDALALLNAMSRALHDLSYRGVATLQRGDDMQVVRVSHSVNDGLVNEHLTQLTGSGAGFVRKEHPLNCVHPGHRLLRLGAHSEGDCGIARFYRLRVAPGDLVAGRQSQRLIIEPRDMYRFGYVLEVDKETKLLLSMLTLGRGGKTLERFQFASLEAPQEEPPLVRQERLQRVAHPHPDRAPQPDGVVGRGWSVNWLPAGFEPTDAARGEVRRRTYTDGLAVMSIFMESLSRDIRPGEGVSRSGGTLSYTRGLILEGDPVLITVLGEVPLNTARMVADSVRWAH